MSSLFESDCDEIKYVMLVIGFFLLLVGIQINKITRLEKHVNLFVLSFLRIIFFSGHNPRINLVKIRYLFQMLRNLIR